jgi:hypothetical protein
LQSGTEAVSKGGSLWRVSWLLLGACQEVTQKSRIDQRAPQARSMIVKKGEELEILSIFLYSLTQHFVRVRCAV